MDSLDLSEPVLTYTDFGCGNALWDCAWAANDDISSWDVEAAARAHDHVETWRPNYRSIGLTEITAEPLRDRLDA